MVHESLSHAVNLGIPRCVLTNDIFQARLRNFISRNTQQLSNLLGRKNEGCVIYIPELPLNICIKFHLIKLFNWANQLRHSAFWGHSTSVIQDMLVATAGNTFLWQQNTHIMTTEALSSLINIHAANYKSDIFTVNYHVK